MSKSNTAYKEERKCWFPIPVLPVSCQSEEVHIVWQLLQLQRHLLALCVFVSVSVCLCPYLATEKPGKNPRTILFLPQFCRNKIRHRSEREREREGERGGGGGGRRRIVCEDGEVAGWVRTWNVRVGSFVGWQVKGERGWMDGWMDLGQNARGSSFFFFFFFSFRFPRKLKGKEKGNKNIFRCYFKR